MSDARGGPFAPGLLHRLPGPRRVAVVRASRIGDFVCATPALRALRRALPNAELTLVALPLVEPLAERSPHIDRFEAFPGYPGIAEQFFEARRTSAFVALMQGRRFDLAVQLHGSGVYSNPFTLMLGARATVGMVRPGDPAGALDAAWPVPEHGHEVDRLLAFVEHLGAPARGAATEFPLLERDCAEAARLLGEAPRPLIGVHAAAREEDKRWPLDALVRATAALLDRRGGCAVMLGSDEAQPEAQAMAAALGARCLDLTGRTSLPVLGAVVARLSLLLTADSAPAHIAYALRAPSVTLFRTTDPARWGPPGGGPHAVLLAVPKGDLAARTVAAAEPLLDAER